MRNKFKHYKKSKYKIKKWSKYNKSLINRGSLTFWFSDDSIKEWNPIPEQKVGAPQQYSNTAIETFLTVRSVYRLALRQTEGFLKSVVRIMKLSIKIPSYSNIPKRYRGLKIPRFKVNSEENVNIIIDSSGLKIYGPKEFYKYRDKLLRRRSWRKIHLAVDNRGSIYSSKISSNKDSDSSMVVDLLNKIKENIETMKADGAYDTKKLYKKLKSNYPETIPIIPPRKNARYSNGRGEVKNSRDANILLIKSLGKRTWEEIFQFSKRNIVENVFYRYKTILGPKMRSRKLISQEIESMIGCNILNKMRTLGMPVSCKVT